MNNSQMNKKFIKKKKKEKRKFFAFKQIKRIDFK